MFFIKLIFNFESKLSQKLRSTHQTSIYIYNKNNEDNRRLFYDIDDNEMINLNNNKMFIRFNYMFNFFYCLYESRNL